MKRKNVRFLVGKSPLAHIKPVTIPRLELPAAILASSKFLLVPRLMLDEKGLQKDL